MEQHAVPQPITSYEFRLVGDMTIKQFGKLAAGLILALIVYAINPPALIKWVFIFLFSGVGAAMAFVPFEGRPIDIWIIAFFKRIYSPTQYIWRQKEKNAISGSQNQPKSVPVSPPPQFVQPVVQPTPKIEKVITPFYAQPNAQPINKTFTPPMAPISSRPSSIPNTPQIKPNVLPPPIPHIENKKVEAKFTTNVVVPATPSLPNLMVGFIRDKAGKLVEGAILEIRDGQGNPVRAFKTNKLGQFLSATPLHSGMYEIETEKEGYQFDIIKVNLEGKILSPIEIVSK